MKKILEYTMYIAIIWFVASYIDILAHNLSDYNYAFWNAFTIFS